MFLPLRPTLLNTMRLLGFIRTLLFSLILATFLVDWTKEVECAFSDFAEQSAKLKINEYNLHQSSNIALIGGIRFQNSLIHEIRFSPKNNFIGFANFSGIFLPFLPYQQTVSFCLKSYSANLLWTFYVPKYLLFHRLLV